MMIVSNDQVMGIDVRKEGNNLFLDLASICLSNGLNLSKKGFRLLEDIYCNEVNSRTLNSVRSVSGKVLNTKDDFDRILYMFRNKTKNYLKYKIPENDKITMEVFAIKLQTFIENNLEEDKKENDDTIQNTNKSSNSVELSKVLKVLDSVNNKFEELLDKSKESNSILKNQNECKMKDILNIDKKIVSKQNNKTQADNNNKTVNKDVILFYEQVTKMLVNSLKFYNTFHFITYKNKS